MKSLTAVCQTGASMPAIHPSGRITRHPHHRGDGENAEMKMYLSKLKDLVPFMPKNRKLSKLEIIQHVIDYICDLQSELETHPEINNFDPSAALTYNNSNNNNNNLSPTQQQQQQQQYPEGNIISSEEHSPIPMEYDNMTSSSIERLTASTDNGVNNETQPPQSSQSMLIVSGGSCSSGGGGGGQRSSLLSRANSGNGNIITTTTTTTTTIRQPLVDRHVPNTILPIQSNNIAGNLTDMAMMTALPQQNLNNLARPIFATVTETITNTQAIISTTVANTVVNTMNSMDVVSTIDDNNSLQRLLTEEKDEWPSNATTAICTTATGTTSIADKPTNNTTKTTNSPNKSYNIS